MRQSINKCLFIQKKIHLWIKIIDKRGEVNFNQWMKMVKSRNGFNLMGSHECKGLIHVLLKHIPLHEQVLLCDAIVLMEME
jgi:hypothetical protein